MLKVQGKAYLPRMEHHAGHVVDMPPQCVHLPGLCVCASETILSSKHRQLHILRAPGALTTTSALKEQQTWHWVSLSVGAHHSCATA